MSPSAKSLGKRKADASSGSETDPNDALELLNSSGQAFLQSFGNISKILPKKAKRPRKETPPVEPEEDDDEWGGFEDEDETAIQTPPTKAPSSGSKAPKSVPPAVPMSDPNVIVFSEQPRESGPAPSIPKAAAKAFMSSKVSRVLSAQAEEESKDEEEEGDEKSLHRNDKELFKLLHTQLLTGAVDSEIHTTNGQRQRALQGRILELSGKAKVGQGIKVVHHEIKNHQPKRQRDKIEAREKNFDAARRAEAEENGLYHASMKKSVFLQKEKYRPRIKGIGSGIGKFKDGTLTISKSEIASVTGPSRRGGRGGGRGGGGGFRGGSRGGGRGGKRK